LGTECFGNIRTVKAFANTRNEIRKFDEINKRIIAIGHRKAVFSGINQAVSYGLLYFTLACVLYFGVTGSLTGRYKTITN